MAAFTAPCATADTTTRSVRWTSWQKQGSEEEEGKCESEDMTQRTVLEKTHEFFQMCDIENKGFISRRDMQRLNGRLPFSAEELENVFDVLDSDSNGYLTLDEFSSGFSDFLFGQRIPVEEDMGEKNRGVSPPEVLYQSQRQESLVTGEEDEEEEHFSMLMDSLGANSVFEDPAEVRSLWAQLQRDEPHLLSNFEDFLARVTSQIIEANQEKKEMESALKRKVATHGDEIQHLYEEMEQQIKNEKERIALQDHERFLSRRRDLELQLSGKERELEQLSQKQRRLERQCQDLHSEHHETKEEIVKLKQTNDELTRELEHTSQELMLAQDQLSLLQEQSTRLHEEKEMEIYKETEGLQRERASLLKQLDLLREMNKHLRNEKDIRYQNSEQTPGVKQRLSINAVKLNSNNMKSVDEELTVNSRRHSLTNGSCQRRGHLQRIISIEEDHLPHLLQMDHQVPSLLQECSEGEEATEEDNDIELVMSDIIPPASSTPQQEQQKSKREEGVTPTFPRGQPVGKDTSVDDGSPSPLNRLFKIVLVGNSNVGKTSFLRRFCDDCFNPGTATTLSIDYTVKTITVDGSPVALQIWDTVGQERYGSITKQFFRKADGVVVMYDITATHSFTAVRQWLTSVKESAGEDVPIMLLANKTDKESKRQVQGGVGEKLAKDCQISFYECSAYSGHNVVESMVHLCRILKEQEDREKEETVQLVSSSTEKKKSCC